MPLDGQVNVATAISESNSTLATNRDQNRLTRNLGIKELAPPASLGQPRTLVGGAFHEHAPQDARSARGTVPTEADNAGDEAPLFQCACEDTGARLAN